MMEPLVVITRAPLSVSPLREMVLTPACGAVVTFEGVVRDQDESGEVSAIDYEAYESMAEKEISRIVREASAKWADVRIAVAHRWGLVRLGETSVIVVAASPHRNEAFLAGRYAIDEIKKRAPIWKRRSPAPTAKKS